MSTAALINSAHQPGHTSVVFSRDGSRVYTGGTDSLVRLWRSDLGPDQEPDAAVEAAEEITSLAAGRDSWFSASADAEVRQYEHGNPEMQGLVTSANGVPIRCVAVDPKGDRIAVASDEPDVKIIDLTNTTNVVLLKGHTKAVRKATWHPSSSLLATSGADGRIIVWDVSDSEAKVEKVIEGVIPAVANTESEEFSHDCSAVWHTSGQHFFVATRAHEIVTISRSDWSKSSTYSDDASSGAITALALSKNGVYLASASKSGVFIWSTQTRRLLFRYQGALGACITQMAFSPSQNLIAWTDMEGVLTRWPEPIPATSPDPVKITSGTTSATAPVRRKGTPTLFDEEADNAKPSKDAPADGDEDLGDDIDYDDFILDDLGGGMDDDNEEKRWAAKEGVREMVSVTKAQPPFQPGSTPMENKKRYLAYNMIGVIEVTDQDTHHIVNVEFHDKSLRKGYHFTDHSKYDLASLGERGAVYSCQPENDHPAHVIFKPYGTWATQGEWTYELPKGTRVLGVAAGGPPPSKSSREKTDSDLQGNGNVVIATSENELIFLTGTGIERHCLSLQGDFVSMVAGFEWVFVVHRDGATTMDGSQNLTGRLIKFDDFCLLQKDSLPVPKRHTLIWIGITEEGAPAIYDSAGVLNIMPRFRLPFSATWTRALDTNSMDRREGKQESYWPVGVAGDLFMCLILKGRQEYPAFPKPLIQELQLRFPFHRTDPKEAPLEEHFARESMLLDILRDGLGDDLTTDGITTRELALDKELVQLIQNACKNDKLARALDLTKLLHLTPSFDMAIKIAGFYHLIGLQEKMEALKDDREATHRLSDARDKRKQRMRDLVPLAAPRPAIAEPQRPKAFQDFRPPPAKRRPGLERATPAPAQLRSVPPSLSSQLTEDATASAASYDDAMNDNHSYSSPDGKRKRASEDISSPGTHNIPKRRAIDEIVGAKSAAPSTRSNPFARRSVVDNGRNPFTRSADVNKSLHKSESFFTKVDTAEVDKGKKALPVKGKAKDKKGVGKQMTLFGLPPSAAPEKTEKKSGTRRKDAVMEELQDSSAGSEKVNDEEVAADSQITEIDMDVYTESNGEADEEPVSQLTNEGGTTSADTGVDPEDPGSPPIEWPPSPVQEGSLVDAIVGS